MVNRRDNLSRFLAFASVGFGALALSLACVGIGTPNWQVTYQASSSGSGQLVLYTTNNFFYACGFSANGSVIQCVTRNVSLIGYLSSAGYTPSNDTNLRLQNAAGLTVVGILLLAFGTVVTLLMAILALSTWLNLIPPTLLFAACLFMLAGLAEGSRVLLYNDYAAQLYISAHLFTILSFGLSALAAGRFHFERMYGDKL